MICMRQTSLLGVLLLVILSACGPTVTQTDSASNIRILELAVLPIKTSKPIQREKLVLLRSVLENELRNAGYALLDPEVVSTSCNNQSCNGLGNELGVDSLASMTLDSFSRTNFLAGVINNISGELSLLEKDGAVLFTVNHSEQDRAGLLFNTGQLLEGIQSYVDSTGDRAFGQLAQKFIRAIVLELPAPERTSTNQGHIPEIETVKLEQLRGGISQLCVIASPKQRAFLVLGSIRTDLREVKSGFYCGRYQRILFKNALAGTIELRSSYGDTVTRLVESER